jgi:hypothetical protein
MRSSLTAKILYSAHLLSFSYAVSAQSLPDVISQTTLSTPSQPGQVFGIDRVMELVKHRSNTSSDLNKSVQPICYGTNPSFLFAGPDLTRTFQGDPYTDGNALVLQGEMMIAIGQVLLQQGRALLEKASKELDP